MPVIFFSKQGQLNAGHNEPFANLRNFMPVAPIHDKLSLKQQQNFPLTRAFVLRR